jgi:hypothetical protein
MNIRVARSEPDFNRAVKLEVSIKKITSHVGVWLLREADFKLKLTFSIPHTMIDSRMQDPIRYAARTSYLLAACKRKQR